MSAESQVLQTAKLLAAQYKPLIEAIPELQKIVSLQSQTAHEEGKLARVKQEYDDEHSRHKARLNETTENYKTVKKKHDDLVQTAQELANKVSKDHAAAQSAAKRIEAEAKANAEETAKAIIAAANQQANDLIKATNADLGHARDGVRSANLELQAIQAKKADAEKALADIHKLLDAVRPR